MGVLAESLRKVGLQIPEALYSFASALFKLVSFRMGIFS